MYTKVARMWLMLIAFLLLTACAEPASAPAATPRPTQAPSTVDPLYANQGGGDPRTIGYWLLWNSCAADNRAAIAAANGGREAGWIILDDLLVDPGMLVGMLSIETCEQGLAVLQQMDLNGQDAPDDASYALAAQLLAAQLNLAAGAEYCTAIEQAVQSSQLLLYSLDFNGTGTYLDAAHKDTQLAGNLANLLASYNIGELCR